MKRIIALAFAWLIVTPALAQSDITQVIKEFEYAVTGTASTKDFAADTGLSRQVRAVTFCNKDTTDTVWLTTPVPGITPTLTPAVASSATKNQLELEPGVCWSFDYFVLNKFSVIGTGNAQLRVTSTATAQ